MSNTEALPPLDTEAGALWLVADVQRSAGERLQRDGQLSPMAYIIARADPSTGEPFAEGKYGMIILDVRSMPSVVDKNNVAGWIRATAARGHAIGVALVAEAWTIHAPGLSPEEFTDEMRRWAGRMHTHPQRVEVLNLTIEHRAFDPVMRLYQAPIVRDWKGRPKAGAWAELLSRDGSRPGAEAEGRLTQFLPPVE